MVIYRRAGCPQPAEILSKGLYAAETDYRNKNVASKTALCYNTDGTKTRNVTETGSFRTEAERRRSAVLTRNLIWIMPTKGFSVQPVYTDRRIYCPGNARFGAAFPGFLLS